MSISSSTSLSDSFVSGLFEAALTISGEAARLLVEHSKKPRTIHHKGRIDLVTETDLAIEKFLKEKLASLDPKAHFLAEESANSLQLPDTCWIIDPVDGTTNYAHGLPIVGICLAYYAQGAVQFGIVETPLLNERYFARKDHGAFCNGQPLAVSREHSLENSLVATGFPYDIDKKVDIITRRLHSVLPKTQGLRRCGAASIDLVWLANGRYEAFFEAELKPWDVAAGMCILCEAGGMLTHFDGSAFTFERPDVLASNGLVHEAMVDLLGAR